MSQHRGYEWRDGAAPADSMATERHQVNGVGEIVVQKFRELWQNPSKLNAQKHEKRGRVARMGHEGEGRAFQRKGRMSAAEEEAGRRRGDRGGAGKRCANPSIEEVRSPARRTGCWGVHLAAN